MSNPGENAGNVIKKGWATFHGAGEALRGSFNTFADSVTGTDKADSKNHVITERGREEMETGKYQGTGAGVTPADTPQERINRAAQGETDHRS